MQQVLKQLESLVQKAKREVLLVAPFIKRQVLHHLLKHCSGRASLRCVTRWRAEEVHRGVSDLEIFDLLASNEDTQLLLRHDLHAKFYRGDSSCLVGSANLTGRALGLTSPSNLELLIPTTFDTGILRAFEHDLLRGSVPATKSIRDAVQDAVDALGPASEGEPESWEISELKAAKQSFGSWLPRCTVPQQLFSVYQGDRSILPSHTFEDASDDLEAMSLPPNLDANAFRSVVASRLHQHPALSLFIAAGTRDLLDRARDVLAQAIENSADFENIDEAENIIEQWLTVFFPARSAIRQGSPNTHR